MDQDAAIKDTRADMYDAARRTTGRPLRDKKSLTRLFTTSRPSSRSRAPSAEDTGVPTTPTIPEHYLSTSRKASRNEASPAWDDGHKSTLQSVVADVTNTGGFHDGHSSNRMHRVRGILKPQTKTLPGNLSERENQTPPTTPGSIRSGATKASSKRHRGRSSTFQSSNSPKIGKATAGGIIVEDPTPSFTRNRGASTPSLTLSRLRDSLVDASVPSRPSTSGGEPMERAPKAIDVSGEDYHGSGLSMGALSGSPRLNDMEIRASFRSAITSDSSVADPSTARSSVLTKDTSVSDVTLDPPRGHAGDEGMTVEEAIGMYENGFADDVDVGHADSYDSSISEDERRRSIKIAEAMNNTIGPVKSTAMHLSTSFALEAATSPSTNNLRGGPQKAPQLMAPTTTCDQYGFLKASRYISITQYDTWNRPYASEQLRRTKKWYTYMAEQGCPTNPPAHFPDRGPKTLRYVRKGIPPAWRGAAWFYYSGGARMLEKNPDIYPSLLARTSELNSCDVESIERDLHRTFPDNVHFRPEEPSARGVETPLLSSLRHVLQAFAIYHPQIGYCQSLNFLAGLLLLFLSEERTFWMLNIITADYLPGTHEISLEGANVDLWVLMLALRESSPGVWAKVGVGDEDVSSTHTARLPPISLCTTSWFMSMFIGTLPIESVLRVWDAVFYEGSKMLFRIALAIFKMGEQEIKSGSDSMELFQVVQSFPRGILDIGALMGLACRRGGISQEWITKKRKDRRKWYATQKAKAAGTPSTVDGEDSASAKGTPNLSRANSAWRRRVGLLK
ncbi:MAG: hypothetical protein L6R39_004566 [Caloplaca ligustica]|nr:MAG: hypothetical protein L6R39_004566 [Caloplaca ligustica]